MTRIILSIYDSFRKKPLLAWIIFILATVALVLSLLRLQYKEDISDFLPLDESNQTNLSIYQDVSGANKIFAIIGTKDNSVANPQLLADAAETFASHLQDNDSSHYISNIMTRVDMEQMLDIADSVYTQIPYFLTDADYSRIDSLLAVPGYIEQKIAENKELLLFPTSNIITQNISRDPLNLFGPVMGRLSGGGVGMDYETYDGYILTPDSKRAIVIVESAFGASESQHNGELVQMLDDAQIFTENKIDNIDIHIIGGPSIAVTNASQIKHDSIIAVTIAIILILALLIYVFRNARNIFLILISVGWGWLFAMGCIALVYDSISIIVIGIASIILGIAVNYPLHLIDHLKNCTDTKSALKEIISPLVVGNVTTVGAFLCLVPLDANALHDLGLFSSLLLIGTIIFVLVFLPHAVKTRKPGQRSLPEPRLITRIADISVEKSQWVVWSILILTLLFAWFSIDTEFDTDMRNINFMTKEQRSDMEYFSSLTSHNSGSENLYIVSSGDSWDKALTQYEKSQTAIDDLRNENLITPSNSITQFLHSQKKQSAKLHRWKHFLSLHPALTDSVRKAGIDSGFNSDAFDDFYNILSSDYKPLDFSDFNYLTSSVFQGNISYDATTGRYSIVNVVEVNPDNMELVKNRLENDKQFGSRFFDVKSMNGSIANTLSDDFNYIGLACGCIVFLFLWIALGNIELAIVSFLPMAISWIWILGIMSILGIKFNIVNVILATFIFGQGDDYTIFMTEGLSYEFAYRKKLLASYKQSIIVSALIMFIGIGTLIFAEHPAMKSLGEVTVVGMLSVVLMAYFFPPFVFNWLVSKRGEIRYQPITLKSLFTRKNNPRIGCTGNLSVKEISKLVLNRYRYKGGEIERTARKQIKNILKNKDIHNLQEIRVPIIVMEHDNRGELSLILSLMYPESRVYAVIDSEENRILVEGCTINFVNNLIVIPGKEFNDLSFDKYIVFATDKNYETICSDNNSE
ncbi:MAG: MMPL family transporter [Muribaculaceae bacterium]|nr:MMPL family transporter [Muribaculaceae bacterium]